MRKIFLFCFIVLIANAGLKAQSREEIARYARMKYRESVQLSLQEQYQKAVDVLERLLLTPDIEQAERDLTGILYALACNYSLLNEKAKALVYLEKAVGAGFADYGLCGKER